MDQRDVRSPHVLIFPLPCQGHVTPTLKLAELLSLNGLHVTFLNTEHNQKLLLRHTDIQARMIRYPGFRFQTISDGLPMDHPRTLQNFGAMFVGLKAAAKVFFREMMISTEQSSDTWPLVSCIITDGMMSSFTIEAANEVRIPIILFHTLSACGFWTMFSAFKLIESGELSSEGCDMDELVTSIPGMEGFLRKRDLPCFLRTSYIDKQGLQFVTNETQPTPRARALILNTFEELEGPILAQIRNHCSKTFAIGPVHAHLKSRLDSEATSQSSNSFRQEDRNCLTWLDGQPSKSVIYVSFGSMAVMTRKETMELGYGLVNSGSRFLWVISWDSLDEKDVECPNPAELLEEAKERGYIVEWAPQEEVLEHPAVGGFLTHCGWNSTLESISAGVPMICWPCFGDHHINSRFASHVWKLGLDMKDTCDRIIIEKMVREVMEERKEEFMETADLLAKRASKCVTEVGSSYCNLNSLIEEIRLLSA